ncbi:hypothetical protein QJS10_CPB14g00275 [Acorus calamus]|uniref:Peptidyl-prolyl cis-trans isomerase n=1 Tax=Acorus calamus TaxID=4465 RepID=A0AAV9DFB9_ACOCL|nr:hypothetical protein QJS10_CPB14g00275 [Acorus calamus]
MARIKPQALLLQSKKKKGPTRMSVTTIITFNLIVVLIVLSLYATYRHWYQRPNKQSESGLSTYEDLDAFGNRKRSDVPSFAILNTSKGSITVELNREASPETVDKFLNFCEKGYFKGMHFHRVIKNYVIQGGDAKHGAAEDWTLKGKSLSQLATSPKHEAFMFGTSKAKRDSDHFELFITTAPIPDLRDKLIVFGRVVKGEDVVQEIEEVDTDEHYRPKSPIGIIGVELTHQT